MASKVYSCDTFVVRHEYSTIFGKNSDRPSEEPQEVIYVKGSKFLPRDKLKCTYIEIDQVPETQGVILSKPTWMWGAEMGGNECGVVIGNEAVWSNVIDPEPKRQLLGMDLVRLGLERSKDAYEALLVITSLLEKYGQGGPCSVTQSNFTYHNSFLIADHKEAWILETIEKYWAAERIIHGFRNISNSLSIGENIELMSDGLKEQALQKGYWNGTEPFNFAKIFGDGEPTSRFTNGKALLNQYNSESGSEFDVRHMIKILRDEKSGINRGGYNGSYASTGSQVSILKQNGVDHCCHWFTATPDPSFSIYKPFIFGIERNAGSISTEFTSNDQSKSRLHEETKHILYSKHMNNYKKIPQSKLLEIENKFMENAFSIINCKNEPMEKSSSLFNDAVQTELILYNSLN